MRKRDDTATSMYGFTQLKTNASKCENENSIFLSGQMKAKLSNFCTLSLIVRYDLDNLE